MTSSIQVSEELEQLIELAEAVEPCPSKYKLIDKLCALQEALAMRSKDHSIAVDDVREALESCRAYFEAREATAMLEIVDAAITAIGSQSIEGERG